MKKIFTKKRISILVIVLLTIVVLTTLLVGNYFIDYALKPYSGGEEREPVADVLPSGVEAETQTVQQIVEKNRALEDQLVDEWLNETKDLMEEVEITSHDDLTLRGHAFYQEEPSDDWAVDGFRHGINGLWT